MATYNKYQDRYNKKHHTSAKLSPDQRRQLQTDKDAYITYLEENNERIS